MVLDERLERGAMDEEEEVMAVVMLVGLHT